MLNQARRFASQLFSAILVIMGSLLAWWGGLRLIWPQTFSKGEGFEINLVCLLAGLLLGGMAWIISQQD